jgi:hypothetical protein
MARIRIRMKMISPACPFLLPFVILPPVLEYA